MRIGLISDTHTPYAGMTLWDEVAQAFAGVDLILHAGDIVHPVVLDDLERIAPVLAARGNNDFGYEDHRVKDVQRLEVAGQRLLMVHDLEPEDRPLDFLFSTYLRGERADILVSGHTHLERLDYREGVLQINPGSATLPHLWSYRLGTVALLEWSNDGAEVRILRLGHTEGLRNPGIESTYSATEGITCLDS
jgi:putative phosphoesterase